MKLFLQFEDLVKNADAWTPFPRDTDRVGLGRDQKEFCIFKHPG